MRFEHEGISLWYGTPDAPAPEQVVRAGAEINITVGVHPVDSSNRVEIRYRVNQGPVETASARWLKTDPSGKAQYFRARFPGFRAGDIVEYLVICGCSGRRVPSPAEANKFASSFRVIEDGMDPGRLVSEKAARAMDGPPKASQATPGPRPTTISTDLADTNGPPFSTPFPKPTPTLPSNPSPPSPPGSKTRRVEGRILFDYGLPAGGVTLRLYGKGFAGVETRLGEVKTDAQGFYALSYDTGGKPANLEARVVNVQGQEISISGVKYNASEKETLNLVAPTNARPLAAEYQRLSADLSQQIGGQAKLGDAREKGDRRDLTMLSQATGWDARLIALAATASKLSADTGISQDALYALYRAGLPTDKQGLAHVSPVAAGKALGKAREAGIVSLNDQQIAAAQTAFENFALSVRRTTIAPGALSSFGDLLSQSALTAAERGKFERLYMTYGGTPDELWRKAAENGIPQTKIAGLQLQGKLAYLTFNNAALTQQLQQEIGSLDNLAQLVDKGLYRAKDWKDRINAMAGGNEEELKRLIPPAYEAVGEGAATAARLEAYAADMARKVRLSFPMRVVRRMVANDEVGLGARSQGTLAANSGLKAPVGAFLANAEELGYEMGRTPLGAFIKQNEQKLFQGVPQPQVEATTQSVNRLQRLYQITPSDDSFGAMTKSGFDSAYDVVAFSQEEFVVKFGDLFPSEAEARLIYRKAQQVTTVVYNFFTIAKQMEIAPPVRALAAPPEVKTAAKDELIKLYPTMESLFGSPDFCECEHCRSVLSPAAYLVDLLQFLDRDELVWKEFLDKWKKNHNGKAYDGPDYNYKKPFDALIEKRPDLPHLPLTCENTNTAMPYIDLVNEILEYYVDKGNLDKNAACDTGEATTPELLAEPQNILPGAYTKLLDARYPLGLPFDLWIETVRRFFDHYETPLWQVLEIFRISDELFAPAASPKPYYRAAIFAEYLGIAPVEYGLFTNPNPQQAWPGLYGYDTETGALAALKFAKTLSRRLGVTYKELIDIAQTGFVNPQLDKLVVLRKLGVSTEDVFRYKGHAVYQAFTADERTAFEQRLDDLTEKFNQSGDSPGFNARTWLDTAWQNGDFNRILVLADPDTGCNFDQTILRHANGDDAEWFVFLKINLLVRLWKKLCWTIEETDRALLTFLPGTLQTLTAADIGERFKTALIYMAHVKSLNVKLNAGKDGLQKLFTFWSNLPTTGKNPLYARLFLTESVLKNDPVFDDPLGQYLSKPGVLIKGHKDHLLALEAALNLTADEIERVLTDAGESMDTAELSLGNVSLLFRYGLLAKALNLPVRDLLALKALTGLDPFKALSVNPITTIANDHPFSQTLRFVELAEKVKESGFGIEDLDYLLRHRFDPVGKYRSKPEALLALAQSLATELRRIRAEHAVPADPAGLTDDTLRQKLALALPPDVAEIFMGMWAGVAEFEAVEENIPPEGKLDPAAFAAELAIRVSYDKTRQRQRLVFRGALLDAKKIQLTTDNPSSTLAALLNTAQKKQKEFFEKNFVDVVPPFLAAGDFDLLFAPIPDNLTEDQKQDQARSKRKKLAEAFLLYLQQRLARQLIAQALATDLATDLSLVEALATNAVLLSDPTQAGKSLLEAFMVVYTCGVSVAFYDSTDLTGSPSKTATVTTADTAVIEGANPVKPATARSARFEGYLEVPAAGAYRFFAVCEKAGAEAELRFAHLPEPLFRGVAANDGEEISQFIELKAGLPYRFTLEACNLGAGDLKLLALGENLPKDAVGQLTLYPETVVERFSRAYTLLSKTLQIIAGFGLNEREASYLLTHPADFPELDLSRLPTREADDSLPGAQALFAQFTRLADYARLKQELAGGGADLIGVFENARRAHREIAGAEEAKTAHFEPFARLTRREASTVRAAAESLGFTITTAAEGSGQRVETPDLANEKGLMRLWVALKVVEKLGVPTDAIVRWTEIINPVKNPDERFAIARELKNTVKARYEQENWRRIAQSIFDKLRQRQRDALVAYILDRLKFERVEQLFEYFLIDPGMEPVAQTSRLRLAISSVQLFIQRCLLNLEPSVHPSAVNAAHWQWVKRYRVWEANRKIFLFPENWLEPEFRDDKTHLFQELESALLQGDISNDLAEDAFFRYLKKLEELARLEIVTIYCEENPHDRDSNTLHVIGRTFNQPHKYFYRRYAHQMWTPWEPVVAEIEGDHVVAVIWRERLHLFWLTFLEKPRPMSTQPSNDDDEQGLAVVKLKNLVGKVSANQPLKDVEVQLNWCEFFQGKWTKRESSGFGNPIRVGDVGTDFDRRSVFIHVSKEDENGEERAVKINLRGSMFKRAFRVVSKNSPPETDSPPAYFLYPPYLYDDHQLHDDHQASQFINSGPLKASFVKPIKTEDGELPEFPMDTVDILREGRGYALLSCVSYLEQEAGLALLLLSEGGTLPAASLQEVLPLLRQAEIKSLISPVFYQDDRHTFFIEPTLVETTIAERDGWIIPPLLGDPKLNEDQYWKEFPLDFEAPGTKAPIPIDPTDPRADPRAVNPIDPISRFSIRAPKDWLTKPATTIRFDGNPIGQGGRRPATGIPNLGNVVGGGLSPALAESLNLRRDLQAFNNGDLSDGPFNR